MPVERLSRRTPVFVLRKLKALIADPVESIFLQVPRALAVSVRFPPALPGPEVPVFPAPPEKKSGWGFGVWGLGPTDPPKNPTLPTPGPQPISHYPLATNHDLSLPHRLDRQGERRPRSPR